MHTSDHLNYLYVGPNACSENAVRLRLGPTIYSGLLEVCHGGHWGTVCGGSSVNNNLATVVCRQLGYSEDAVVEVGTPYGQGDGIIWLSELQCEGAEATLMECSHLMPVGNLSTSCPGHTADINIRCSGKQ